MKYKEGYILAGLTIAEIISYYFFPHSLNLLLKSLPTLFILYTYRNKMRGYSGEKERLFYTSFVFCIFGEYAFNYRNESLGLMLIILFYLIEHQLYIMIFRREKAIAYGIEHRNYFQKGVPYIIVSFIFFGVFLMNNVPDSYFVMVLLYVVQLAILGTLSILRPVDTYSKTMIILAIAVNTFSDAISSIHLFVGHFFLEYALVRSTFILSRYLMSLGFAGKRS